MYKLIFYDLVIVLVDDEEIVVFMVDVLEIGDLVYIVKVLGVIVWVKGMLIIL